MASHQTSIAEGRFCDFSWFGRALLLVPSSICSSRFDVFEAMWEVSGFTIAHVSSDKYLAVAFFGGINA